MRGESFRQALGCRCLWKRTVEWLSIVTPPSESGEMPSKVRNNELHSSILSLMYDSKHCTCHVPFPEEVCSCAWAVEGSVLTQDWM